MVNLYVIKDVVANVIVLGPIAAMNHGIIYRQLLDMMSHGAPVSDTYRSHPQDFELYCIGQMDENSGKIVSAEDTEMLGRLTQFVKADPMPEKPQDRKSA